VLLCHLRLYLFPGLATNIHLSLFSPCGPWPIFQFLNPYTVGRTLFTGDQAVATPLPTHITQTQNKRTQAFIPRVGFEPTIPVFERTKKIHALDRGGHCDRPSDQ
jgi:hypothetical protein